MINNTYLNPQKPVTATNAKDGTVLQINQQSSKSMNIHKVEVLAQYQTAIENGSLEQQLLSQRGYNKGYKGL